MLMLAVALAPSWLRPVVGARQHGNEQRYPALFGQLLLCLGRKIVATVHGTFFCTFLFRRHHTLRMEPEPMRNLREEQSI